MSRASWALAMVAVVIVIAGCGRRGGGGGGGGPSPTGGGTGSATNGQVCDVMLPALCDFAIRCGFVAGTTPDCVSELRTECCDGDCARRSNGSVADAESCAAMARGAATCADDEPLSEACTDLPASDPVSGSGSGSPPDDDAGIVISPPPSGGSGGRYEECYADFDCSSASEGCFQVNGFDSYPSICTNRCDGPEDTVHCGSDGACVGQEPLSPGWLCYRRCDVDTDCPRDFYCQSVASGSYVCTR